MEEVYEDKDMPYIPGFTMSADMKLKMTSYFETYKTVKHEMESIKRNSLAICHKCEEGVRNGEKCYRCEGSARLCGWCFEPKGCECAS
jgi:hypothetical protein